MKHLTITTLATAALLAAALAYPHGEQEEEAKEDNHHEMMEQTSSFEDSDHSGTDGHSGGGHDGGGHDNGADHGGMGHSNWMSPEEAANRPNPVEATELSLERGEAAYRVNCVSCHGTGARGDGQLAGYLKPAPPDLVMMAPMHPAEDLAWKIEAGRGAMPAWKEMLSNVQIWDIVNYLKSLADDGDEGTMGHHDGGQDHPHGSSQERSRDEAGNNEESEEDSDEHGDHDHD